MLTRVFAGGCLVRRSVLLLLLAVMAGGQARAEDGSAAWLRYAPIANKDKYASLPRTIVVEGQTPQEKAAGEELRRGLSAMLGETFVVTGSLPASAGRVLLLAKQHRLPGRGSGGIHDAHVPDPPLPPEGYSITRTVGQNGPSLVIRGGSPSGLLYGAFHLLEEVAAEGDLPRNALERPAAPIRWTDEWDNLNGTIERGYAGPSIFFADGHVRSDLTRAGQYARLLASVGINGCNINNVNADLDLLTPEHLREFANRGRLSSLGRQTGTLHRSCQPADGGTPPNL